MISDILPRYQEVANGSKKAFTVPFDTLDSSYINVYLNNTKQSSGYTVSNKVVTFTSAPANGTVITVTRVVPIEWEQEVLGAINQDSLNKIFTKLVAQMQTLKEEVSRAVKTDVTDTESGNDHFLELLEDAIDSLELANTKLEQVIASGTQALSDIDSAKTGAISDFNTNATSKTNTFNTNASEKQALVDEKAEEAEGWAEKAEEYAESVNPENFDHLKGKISNCILEIPQNLKLTLENNILTSKAGNVIVWGGNTYTTTTTTQDQTQSYESANDGRYVVFAARNSGAMGQIRNILQVGSGDTLPADGSQYRVFFTTGDKLFHLWNATTSSWSENWQVAYPLCVVDVVNGVASFAKDSKGRDMIFNGAGFIGHHAFVYPNVKVLRPDGLNTDGTLKSVLDTFNSLVIADCNANVHNIVINRNYKIYTKWSYKEVETFDDIVLAPWTDYYVKSENAVYGTNGLSVIGSDNEASVNFLDLVSNGTTITDFTIRQPVRLATTEMLDSLQSQVDINTTAIAGKQDTLVSGTNIKTINSTSVLGSGNFALADQSLSNLDSTGQMVVDSQNGTISNCVLEIPQNLKFEFSNGTVTLKAGSTIVLSGSTYQTLTITQDTSWTTTTLSNTKAVLFVSNSGYAQTLYGRYALNYIGSGSSLPANGDTYKLFFNTSDKLVYNWDNGSWVATTHAYPPAIIEVDSQGAITGFAKDSKGRDLVFNGCGYIGHHAFVYPNISAFIPNGFNVNGGLVSTKTKTNSLLIYEMPASSSNRRIAIANTGNSLYGWASYSEVNSYNDADFSISFRRYYIKYLNKILTYNGSSIAKENSEEIISYSTTGTTVTDFTIRQPYEGARNLLTEDVEDYINNQEEYTAAEVETLWSSI